MRRFLIASFLLCLFASAARSQGGFTTVTGTITDPAGVKWSCGTISAQLITAGGAAPTLNGGGFTTQTSPVSLGCPTTPGSGANGSFAMRLADSGVISPNNTTWRFTVNTTGNAPPLGTGPQSFTFTTAINCSTNTPSTCTSNQLDISTQLSALAPALGGSSGPSGSDASVTDATIFGVPSVPTGQACLDGNVTSGSATVTSQGLCNFSQADVGAQVIVTSVCSATSTCGPYIFMNSINLMGATQTTLVKVLSVQSATSLTADSNARASCSPVNVCAVVIVRDYTTQLNNGWNAAAAATIKGCPTLQLPAGIIGFSAPIFQQKANQCTGNDNRSIEQLAIIGPSIYGKGGQPHCLCRYQILISLRHVQAAPKLGVPV